MKILIIGGGGREHALAWRLSREGHTIIGAPGNPGIAQLGQTFAFPDHLAIAERLHPDLTVVGPEASLATGIVDAFRARDLRIMGPTQAMARIESSKIYSKNLMQRLAIPTARFVQTATATEAHAALANFNFPVVIKADGLAAGKGVVIAHDRHEADSAIRTLGPSLVLEEFLEGEEVSFIVLSDGRDIVPFDASQDHKTLLDGDTGPNTGGMGAYSDGRILSSADSDRILDAIIAPVIRDTGFTGFLYAGLMMTADGPKVLEFNARLGDPETQPLMHRLSESSSFADVLLRASTSSLHGASLSFKPEPSVCVVLAASGYPSNVRIGDPIHGVDKFTRDDNTIQIFHAGTKIGSTGLETSGGRALGVTASGPDLHSAISNAYSAVLKIHFDGMQYRTDIGRKGLKRWTPDSGAIAVESK